MLRELERDGKDNMPLAAYVLSDEQLQMIKEEQSKRSSQSPGNTRQIALYNFGTQPVLARGVTVDAEGQPIDPDFDPNAEEDTGGIHLQPTTHAMIGADDDYEDGEEDGEEEEEEEEEAAETEDDDYDFFEEVTAPSVLPSSALNASVGSTSLLPMAGNGGMAPSAAMDMILPWEGNGAGGNPGGVLGETTASTVLMQRSTAAG